MDTRKEELIGACAIVMPEKEARLLVEEKLHAGGLADKAVYTSAETAQLCGELAREGGAVEVAIRAFQKRLGRGPVVGAQQREAILREIFEHIPDMIFLLDHDGRVVLANAAFLRVLGLKEEEAAGRNLEELGFGELASWCRECGRKALAAGDCRLEESLPLSGGRTLEVDATIIPLSGPGCGEGALLAICRDNAEKKKQAERALELGEIRSKFTAMVSHELRTPLTGIKGVLDIMLEDSPPGLGREHRKLLEIAKESADHMCRLINEVLDYTRLTEGKLEFHMRLCNVNMLTAGAVRACSVEARKKGLYLNARLTPELPQAVLDPDRVTEVLSNLIGNALKFTLTGGISVSTAISGGGEWIEVRVKDTGPGIKREDLPRLFCRFTRLGSANNVSGSGLGLAISKEIIEAHHGRIWTETPEGGGAEFSFCLPARREL